MPSDGQASSGYLVRHGATSILLDAGPGTAAALTKHFRPHMLSAVYISHLHSDHVYDLLPIGKKILAETTVLDPSTGTAHLESAPRIPLYVPAGAAEKLEALAAVFPVVTQPWMNTPFDLAFKLIEYAPGDRFEVGGISVQLELLSHVEDCCGIRLEADGRSLVYSGDTGVTDALGSTNSSPPLWVSRP